MGEQDLAKYHQLRPAAIEPRTEQNDVEMYLASAPIEPHAAKRFRSLNREQQMFIMSQKVLKHCRDPTIQLYSMISKVEYSSTSVRAQSSASTARPQAPQADDDIDAAMNAIIEQEHSKNSKKKRKTAPDVAAQ